jgi:hypothetical protein
MGSFGGGQSRREREDNTKRGKRAPYGPHRIRLNLEWRALPKLRAEDQNTPREYILSYQALCQNGARIYPYPFRCLSFDDRMVITDFDTPDEHENIRSLVANFGRRHGRQFCVEILRGKDADPLNYVVRIGRVK